RGRRALGPGGCRRLRRTAARLRRHPLHLDVLPTGLQPRRVGGPARQQRPAARGVARVLRRRRRRAHPRSDPAVGRGVPPLGAAGSSVTRRVLGPDAAFAPVADWAAYGPTLLWRLWGVSLGAATLAYALRRRGEQQDPPRVTRTGGAAHVRSARP